MRWGLVVLVGVMVLVVLVVKRPGEHEAEVPPPLAQSQISTSPSAVLAFPSGAGSHPQKSQHQTTASAPGTPSPVNPAHANLSGIPIPAPMAVAGLPVPSRFELWQLPVKPLRSQLDGITQVHLQVDPVHLQQLQPGQTLVLNLPDGGPSLQARITETYNDPMGVRVWKTELQDGYPNSGLFITQGDSETHIAIYTEKGSYSVVVNNTTGAATVINEGEVNARQAQVDDGVVLEQTADLQPPIPL